MLAVRQLLPFTLSLVLAACANDSGVRSEAPESKPSTETAGTAAASVPLTEQEAALKAAAVSGNTDTVKALLDKGTQVDARDENGGTALGHAVWFGHVETVQLLIDRGADVNVKKQDGMTPLQLAIASNHPEVAEVLKKAGAR